MMEMASTSSSKNLFAMYCTPTYSPLILIYSVSDSLYSYLFSTEMAIRENGKLDVDNSVSSIDGYISFNLSDRILHFNYTANATTYDVVLGIQL